MKSIPKVDFQSIFESVPGLYLILLSDLTIVAVSDAYACATMTKRDEILGKGLFEIFPDNPDDHSADGVFNLRASLTNVLKSKAAHTMAVQKYDIRNQDGTFEVRYWSPLNKPVLNSKQEIVYIIHRVEDVTEFVRMRNEKKQKDITNDELQERLKGMEMELYNRAKEIQRMNAELGKKVIELETANKELASFSYSVSHDLRAPVRAVNSFAKIVKEKYNQLFDEEGKRLLNIIIDQAVRMGHLIDDLLAFSQLGKKEIQKSIVDMTSLANEVVDEVLKLAEEKYQAKIMINDLSSANCDCALIRQVFMNLISNSLKFSNPKPEPLIEIGSYSETNLTVYFLKDNGVGFDMKYIDKLFGVFQRLHNDSDFKGTGIGLAIVQRIILHHGGKVWAEGTVNEGATFYFSLPK